jgi:hypothetical protein
MALLCLTWMTFNSDTGTTYETDIRLGHGRVEPFTAPRMNEVGLPGMRSIRFWPYCVRSRLEIKSAWGCSTCLPWKITEKGMWNGEYFLKESLKTWTSDRVLLYYFETRFVGRSNFINHKLSNYMCQVGLLLELSMRRVCIEINLSEVLVITINKWFTMDWILNPEWWWSKLSPQFVLKNKRRAYKLSPVQHIAVMCKIQEYLL